jgi:hypothetical protein
VNKWPVFRFATNSALAYEPFDGKEMKNEKKSKKNQCFAPSVAAADDSPCPTLSSQHSRWCGGIIRRKQNEKKIKKAQRQMFECRVAFFF